MSTYLIAYVETETNSLGSIFWELEVFDLEAKEMVQRYLSSILGKDVIIFSFSRMESKG